jgi:hypothetical protein
VWECVKELVYKKKSPKQLDELVRRIMHCAYLVGRESKMCCLKNTVFARVLCALFFSILAAEKSGCVKYADFCGGIELGFILV